MKDKSQILNIFDLARAGYRERFNEELSDWYISNKIESMIQASQEAFVSGIFSGWSERELVLAYGVLNGIGESVRQGISDDVSASLVREPTPDPVSVSGGGGNSAGASLVEAARPLVPASLPGRKTGPRGKVKGKRVPASGK